MPCIKLVRSQWEFDEAKRLGPAGGFGEVFAGHNADGTKEVAVKRLHLTADEAAHRELRIAEGWPTFLNGATDVLE